MRLNQPYLRLLRRVQAQVLDQTLENFYRRVQLPARVSSYWRENFMHAWRFESRTENSWTNSQYYSSYWCAWYWTTLWLALVRPWKGSVGVWRKWQRSFIYLWRGDCKEIYLKARYRLNLQSPSSRRRWVRIFLTKTTSNSFQCTKLLWRIR